MSVRLDKWLQVARIFKTRTQATKACTLGRVRVNGAIAKPHRGLDVGDEISVDSRDWPRVLKVRTLRDKPVRKTEAPDLYEDLSLPRPRREAKRSVDRPVHRERGTGRPTKRQRRELERWRRR